MPVLGAERKRGHYGRMQTLSSAGGHGPRGRRCPEHCELGMATDARRGMVRRMDRPKVPHATSRRRLSTLQSRKPLRDVRIRETNFRRARAKTRNSVGDASAEAAKNSERYRKKRLRLRLDDSDGESRRSIRTGLALIKDAEKHDVLGKLSRYEASLANAVARTLSLLHSIQASGLGRQRCRRAASSVSAASLFTAILNGIISACYALLEATAEAA